MKMARQVARATKGLANRVGMMVARAIVASVNDGAGLQLVQVELLEDEVRDDIERVQNYGLTSHPQAGAAAVVVFVGGNRDHGLAIAVDDRRFRVKAMAAGEVAVYDDLGHLVHLTREGIVIDGAGHPITITNAPKVRIETGELEVTGEIIDRVDSGGRSMSSMRDIHNDHTHPGDSGGTTGAPGEVM